MSVKHVLCIHAIGDLNSVEGLSQTRLLICYSNYFHFLALLHIHFQHKLNAPIGVNYPDPNNGSRLSAHFSHQYLLPRPATPLSLDSEHLS